MPLFIGKYILSSPVFKVEKREIKAAWGLLCTFPDWSHEQKVKKRNLVMVISKGTDGYIEGEGARVITGNRNFGFIFKGKALEFYFLWEQGFKHSLRTRI